MTVYEQKLVQFASWKRLLRMSKPLRDRADATCDACGSIQPRMLYTLKEENTDRWVFVGVNCLKELVKNGAVLRRFGKASGEVAYLSEMKRRAQKLDADKIRSDEVSSLEGAESKRDTSVADNRALSRPGETLQIPVVLVVEGSEYYRSQVYIVTGRGLVLAQGSATRSRRKEVWRGGGDRGMILEKVEEEIPDALDQSIASAWQECRSHLDESKPVPSVSIDDKRIPINGVPAPILKILRAVATSEVTATC